MLQLYFTSLIKYVDLSLIKSLLISIKHLKFTYFRSAISISPVILISDTGTSFRRR